MASKHEDILMAFDAAADRLNEALSFVGAAREDYLNQAQQNMNKIEHIRRLATDWSKFGVSDDIVSCGEEILGVLDGE